MKQSLAQFGQSIKAKYPQYASIPDEQLGQKMLQKFPQYADMVENDPAALRVSDASLKDNKNLNVVGGPKQEPGFVQGVVQGFARPFLKIGTTVRDVAAVGGNLVQAGFNKISGDEAGAQRNIQEARQANAQADEGTDFGYLGQSKAFDVTGNVVHDLGQGAAAGADIASNFVGGGPKAIASTAGRRILAHAGVGAATGLIGGAANAVENGASTGDVIKESLLNGVFNGLFAGAGSSVSEGVTALTSRRAQEGVVNKAIGVGKNLVKSGKSPAGELLDSKGLAFSTKRGLLKKAEQNLANLDIQKTAILDTVRGDAGVGLTKASLKSQMVARLQQEFPNTVSKAHAERIIDGLPLSSLTEDAGSGYMTFKQIDALRKEIGSQFLSDKQWLSQNPDKLGVAALKATYRTLSDTVKSYDPRLEGVFKKIGNNATLKDVLVDELAKPHVMSFFLQNGIGGGLGALTALANGDHSAKGVGGAAAAGALTYHVAKSAPALTALAAILRGTNRAVNSTAARVGGQLVRLTRKQLVQQSLQGSPAEQQPR